MINTNDWEKTKKRYDDWWQRKPGSLMALVTAPKKNPGPYDRERWSNWSIVHRLDEQEKVLSIFEEECGYTYFAGDSFPSLFVNYGPGVMAAFIGSNPRVAEDTVWFEDPKSWEGVFRAIAYDNDSKWWNYVRDFTKKAASLGRGKYFPGLTDLGGNLDILASLRGAENLAYDLVDSPEEVKKALFEIDKLWFRYYNELHDILKKTMEGTSSWMPVWCRGRYYPLQCDFCAMISPAMFREFALPALEREIGFLDNSIYHLDGPHELPHLDMLLAIKRLDAIQWTNGAGQAYLGSPDWVPLYKKIQEKGKGIVLLGINLKELEFLSENISGRGVLFTSSQASEEEADEMMSLARRWKSS
jgi:hypothetical protein